jgi:hypothetical protein
MITLASLLQSTATPAPDSAWLIAGFALFGAALVLFALEFIIPSAGALATLCVLSIAAGVICFFLHSTMWGFASLAVSLGGAPFVIGYGLQLWSGTPMARRAVLGAQVRGPDVDASALPANGATGTARTDGALGTARKGSALEEASTIASITVEGVRGAPDPRATEPLPGPQSERSSTPLTRRSRPWGKRVSAEGSMIDPSDEFQGRPLHPMGAVVGAVVGGTLVSKSERTAGAHGARCRLCGAAAATWMRIASALGTARPSTLIASWRGPASTQEKLAS